MTKRKHIFLNTVLVKFLLLPVRHNLNAVEAHGLSGRPCLFDPCAGTGNSVG